jgi:alpha-L-fucosidase 2
VAVFLDGIAARRPDGTRKLPLSSSPEINDNRVEAWFRETTNFDLALVRWLYGAAAVMADELGLADEAARWRAIQGEWPELALAEDDGRLLVAPGYPLPASHRHFSHLMAIHPLGLVDVSSGEAGRRTVQAALAELDRLGPDGWCGYSYAWLGSLAARAGEGDKAAQALRTFADCFCLPNSFHANGDQTKSGLSDMTYRPFTLEGNFLAMDAVHEMLLQSWNPEPGPGGPRFGPIRVFPAMPWRWHDAAFADLRAEGGHRVSARRERNATTWLRVVAGSGGPVRIRDNFGERTPRWSRGGVTKSGRDYEVALRRGEAVEAWLDAPAEVPTAPANAAEPAVIPR